MKTYLLVLAGSCLAAHGLGRLYFGYGNYSIDDEPTPPGWVCYKTDPHGKACRPGPAWVVDPPQVPANYCPWGHWRAIPPRAEPYCISHNNLK